jgi:hypothetical protein
MARTRTTFTKGQGGRKPGALNRATRDIKEWAEKFLSSKEYVASAVRRVQRGKAPHLEVLWHHYAFGKPKETVKHEGQIPPFILKLHDE